MSDNDNPIPAPAGTSPADWDTIDGHLFRCIHGQVRGRDGVTVAASAVQLSSGVIDNGAAVEAPRVFVHVPGGGINTADARELAAMLLAAVAEVERWRQQCGGDAEAVTA